MDYRKATSVRVGHIQRHSEPIVVADDTTFVNYALKNRKTRARQDPDCVCRNGRWSQCWRAKHHSLRYDITDVDVEPQFSRYRRVLHGPGNYERQFSSGLRIRRDIKT